MAKKDHRLEKIETDFPKLEDILTGKTNKITNRLRSLKEYVKLYTINPYDACVKLYNFYSLQQNRYPDVTIISLLKKKVYRLCIFFKEEEVGEETQSSTNQLELFKPQ